MTNNIHLLSPVKLGRYELSNRIVMAPLTRNRAGAGNVPTPVNAEYYAQRASAGLIITEASQVSPQGMGNPQTPGIYSKEQVEGWRLVTDAVHERGGRIFLQLWHVGRISHPSLQPDGALPVAPSAIAPEGTAGGYDRDSGNAVLAAGDADLVAYGRLFIANPDLPQRFALNAPLNTPDRSTFYGGNERGYTDYPAFELQTA
jgi:N-ethylmaleimide reductase